MSSSKEIEYEDAYVIEEKTIKFDENEEEQHLTESQDNLELDSLNLSEEISEDELEITADYDKLKLASEISKRKIENQMNVQTQIDKKGKMDIKLKVVKREEVVEDFIRNFFTKYNLNQTLDEFIVSNNQHISQIIFFYYLLIHRKNTTNFPKKANSMTTTLAP